ncbi:MAG: TlpA family protein disulfide reductase [Syntrophales bacterium]
MEKNDKRVLCILFILLALLFTGDPSVWSANVTAVDNSMKAEPGGNTAVPVFELPMPGSEREKSYLGLSGTGNFTIGQVKAAVLIIEVYSFYCPHCQRSAAQVNELYRMIRERPDIKEKIKMIGIAVTNGTYEVDSYRERYKVPFPLIPDKDTEISQKLGVKGTPTFIGLKVNGKGFQERFYFGEGGFEDPRQFLAKIIKLSGLK